MRRGCTPVFTSIAIFCALLGSSASALTVVVNFKSAAQGNTTATTGDTVGAFDQTAYGFTSGQLSTLTSSIMTELNRDYKSIPTQATLAASPIPAGFELNIDFVIGLIGQAPSNGDSEYYYAQVGTGISGSNIGGLGVASTNAIRFSNGADGSAANHATVCSIFTNQIVTLSNLSPSNALTSGDLGYTTFAIEGTLAHEIGHALSLSHINKAGSVQPSGAVGAGGLSPIMGTGALDLPNNDRINDREFSLSGFDGENSNTPRTQIAQLVAAIGLRAVPEPGTLTLLLLAAVPAMMRRRRRAA